MTKALPKGYAGNSRAMNVKFGGKNQALLAAGGARQLAMSIRKIADKELGDEMRAASKAAAQTIVPHAQKRAPRGATGKLVGNIRADSTRSIARVRAGNNSTVKYARAVHAGRWTDEGRTRAYRTRSQPFLREAIPDAWPELVKKYEKGLNDIAKKFQKKHGATRVTGRFVKK
jgi:hypothetical protein